MKRLSISHHRSTRYNPSSHGKVEKVQKLLLDRLRKMENPRLWDSHLPEATFQVNSRVSKTQLVSPLQLLTGVLPKRLCDVEPLVEGQSRSLQEMSLQ